MNNANLIDVNMNNSRVPSVFSNETFGSVRVIIKENGDPLFCLVDVCKILGIVNVSQVANTNLNGKGVYKIYTPTSSGEQEITFVNESSFYKVVLRSNSPKADKFQDWVCSEVLPQIRKTGSYSAQQQVPQTYAQALMAAAKLAEEKERLELENKHQSKEIKSLNNQIEEDAPKVQSFNTLIDSKDNIRLNAFAKILGLSMQSLNKELKNMGMLRLDNLPKQMFINKKIFEVKDLPYMDKNGKSRINTVIYVTPLGQKIISDEIIKTNNIINIFK